MHSLTRRIAREEHGQDLVEYALLSALIAIVAAAGVAAFGGSVSQGWSKLAAKIPDVIKL